MNVQPQDGGEDLVVLSMPGLTITGAGNLFVIGTRPVALAVFGDAGIAGKIIAGPRTGQPGVGAGSSGAGASLKPHCATGRGTAGQSGNNTSGGGGGGAFATDGGSGAPAGNQAASTAGIAGAANGNATLVPLRGGCPGGFGGTNTGATEPGRGGGAIQLSVAGHLRVSGTIAAPGLHGNGADVTNDQNGGGSGAGSGGGLLIEANALQLTPTALILANGGGGGEGDGDPGGGQVGRDGEDGHIVDGAAALGGTGGTASGGDGSAGGAGAVAPVTASPGGPANNAGGGGGGASVGRVRFNVLGSCVTDAGTVSPPATGTCQ